jgi:hypothetical protein
VSLPRLHAPKEHGQILAIPPLDQVGGVLERNRQYLSSVAISSIGKALGDLRKLARGEIRAAAIEYHQAADQPITPADSDTWVVAGHQPELFHPGVWFKNFALHQLAVRHKATALNLIVDTDAAKPAVLNAPAEGRLARVAYDRSTAETPYEERVVEEEATFAALPEKLAPIVRDWPFEPMLNAFWAEAMQAARRTRLLGERFAAARRAIERRWGCVQMEVPMSRVCQTEAFAWFAAAVLSDLPAFHKRYNAGVNNYRLHHHINSKSHPVPDLASDGDWLEAPFWAWQRGQPRRGRLFVRPTPDAWELRAGLDRWPSIPCRRLDDAVAAWRGLEAQGFKVRTRALTTTMFARLFFADTFMHGIGGGIYDELTDWLIERCFSMPAPPFLVVSATLLLPLPRYPEAAQRVRELEHTRRDIIYKPERFAERNASTVPLIDAKQQWIARAGATHAERAERYHRIRELNARLLAHVMPFKQLVEAEHREQQHRAQVNAVAARRDYAFCLYPEEMLRRFFMRDAIDQ